MEMSNGSLGKWLVIVEAGAGGILLLLYYFFGFLSIIADVARQALGG